MRIREYQAADLEEIIELFRTTVHTVNAADYTPEQLQAWTADIRPELWRASLLAHHSLVVVADGRLAGFADMDNNGYLDRLYVHKDYQRRGIATALCDRLEQDCAAPRLFTHASLTARPFFEKRGYAVVARRETERRGVLLSNFLMEKTRQRSA